MKKMQKLVCMLLFVSFALPVFAAAPAFATSLVDVEDGQVMYVGGTVQSVKEGAFGKLDTTQEKTLTFESSGEKLVIPYARIDSFEYSEKLARHLGVVATVVVVLIKHRQRRHFFTIKYHDEKDVSQAVVFEVSKEAPRTLLAVLQTRASKALGPRGNFSYREGNLYHGPAGSTAASPAPTTPTPAPPAAPAGTTAPAAMTTAKAAATTSNH